MFLKDSRLQDISSRENIAELPTAQTRSTEVKFGYCYIGVIVNHLLETNNAKILNYFLPNVDWEKKYSNSDLKHLKESLIKHGIKEVGIMRALITEFNINKLIKLIVKQYNKENNSNVIVNGAYYIKANPFHVLYYNDQNEKLINNGAIYNYKIHDANISTSQFLKYPTSSFLTPMLFTIDEAC